VQYINGTVHDGDTNNYFPPPPTSLQDTANSSMNSHNNHPSPHLPPHPPPSPFLPHPHPHPQPRLLSHPVHHELHPSPFPILQSSTAAPLSAPIPQLHIPRKQSALYPLPPPPLPHSTTSQKQAHSPKLPFENNTSPKIDSSQIPRPPIFIRPQACAAIPIFYPRKALLSDNTHSPPPADSRFITCDDGNAAPQLIRATLSVIPRTRGMQSKSGDLPMSLLCNPLAIVPEDFPTRPRMLPETNETQQWTETMRVPVKENQGSASLLEPPRCHHCNAYANPFFQLNQKMECNFCKTHTDVQATSHGTIEYVVEEPYITRSTPVQTNIIYALDATCPHLESYFPMIEQVGLSIINRESYARMGIVLVSSFGIHIPRFRVAEDGTATIDFVVMSDVTEDPFCPLPLHEWLLEVSATLSESCSSSNKLDCWKQYISQLRQAWIPFLKHLDIKDSYNQMGHASSCGGAAFAFLADAMKETGGRGIFISWRRPNFGIGMLHDREHHSLKPYKMDRTSRELYVPLQFQKQNNFIEKEHKESGLFYSNLASRCFKNRVVLDVVLHTRSRQVEFMDLGTLGQLCRVTCGKLTWVKTSGDWKDALSQALLRPIDSFYGTDAIFKVRCSNGLQVKSYMPSTAMGVTIDNGVVGSPELELGAVHPDTCIAVELEHRVGGIRKLDTVCYVQSALLYTTPFGQRRIRISTLALKVADAVVDVYRGIDFSATTASLTRKIVGQLLDPKQDVEHTLSATRKKLTNEVIQALAAYRLHTPNAANLPYGQLILPEKLQLLPLFCMAMLKSTILRPSLPDQGSGIRVDHPNPRADERAYALWKAANVHPGVAMLMVHPNIFSLTNLIGGAGEWQVPQQVQYGHQSELINATYHAYIKLPETIPPTIASIQNDHIYLIDDGLTIYIFVGKDVSKDAKTDLLEMTSDGCKLSASSDYSEKVRRLVWQLRTYCSIGPGAECSMIRPTFAPVIIVLAQTSQKDQFEERVINLMVQDQKGGEPDYVEFLCRLHKSVNKIVQAKQASNRIVD